MVFLQPISAIDACFFSQINTRVSIYSCGSDMRVDGRSKTIRKRARATTSTLRISFRHKDKNWATMVGPDSLAGSQVVTEWDRVMRESLIDRQEFVMFSCDERRLRIDCSTRLPG